ncbi:bactofilin family protein [Ichthyobacterium seriolicida]|uniref:Integral membrane protein CcmA involved in cell shape determination n=1 Tax=Ichthyobacterium seriolicida TaxID=242600 RepID=A0A1J1E152_9FLAO|nr:polymer-forming cytoskeletal protein [Ichthyobacterium seriolicida]BAV94669.1 hypothetical protein JBKA6_0656 [Ichthyobacterium seriolicida]
MFLNKEEKTKKKVIDMENKVDKISETTTIKGSIVSLSNIRVDGSIIGDISCEGKVILGESGSIKGNINSNEASIEGKVEGNLIISDFLYIKPTANITGDVKTPKIAIEKGAIFNSTCTMSDTHKSKDTSNKSLNNIDGDIKK